MTFTETFEELFAGLPPILSHLPENPNPDHVLSYTLGLVGNLPLGVAFAQLNGDKISKYVFLQHIANVCLVYHAVREKGMVE